MRTKEVTTDPKDIAQRIWDAAEKLNYPSTHAIYLYLKSQNQYVPYTIIDKAYTKDRPERQIFYRPNESRRDKRTLGPKKYMPPNLRQGRVPAADINDRWMTSQRNQAKNLTPACLPALINTSLWF